MSEDKDTQSVRDRISKIADENDESWKRIKYEYYLWNFIKSEGRMPRSDDEVMTSLKKIASVDDVAQWLESNPGLAARYFSTGSSMPEFIPSPFSNPDLKECEVRIRFSVPEDKAEYLLAAEHLLHDAGIDFDTGSPFDKKGFFSREWEFDWSLSDGVKVFLYKIKNKDDPSQKLEEFLLSEGKPLTPEDVVESLKKADELGIAREETCKTLGISTAYAEALLSLSPSQLEGHTILVDFLTPAEAETIFWQQQNPESEPSH